MWCWLRFGLDLLALSVGLILMSWFLCCLLGVLWVCVGFLHFCRVLSATFGFCLVSSLLGCLLGLNLVCFWVAGGCLFECCGYCCL